MDGDHSHEIKRSSLFGSKAVTNFADKGRFVSPQSVAHQAPLTMDFSRQECWSGSPFLVPGDLPDPGIKPVSLALQSDSLPLGHLGSPTMSHRQIIILQNFD